MQLNSKIVQYVGLVTILVSFLISTTGFTYSSHHCLHDKNVTELVTESDDCCSISEQLPVEDVDECCTSSCCDTENTGKDCCTITTSYHKLSDYFLVVYTDESQQEISPLVLKILVESSFDESANNNTMPDNSSKEKIPKLKKYLLYHQVKLDPPLT
jgi:hypothetical protein